MKKIMAVILLFALILCGCDLKQKPDSSSRKENKLESEIIASNPGEFRGVWFSYIDLYFVGLTKREFSNKIKAMFSNIKNIGANAVICQVRANSDAAYPSKYFPFSREYSGVAGMSPGYDPLKIMVETAHSLSLQLHAWVNPYRVLTNGKLRDLPKTNPAYIYMNDEKPENNKNVLFYKDAIYFNPASTEVKNLILSGIKEILDNYDVDGIQFDDYFYPTTEKIFDSVSFDEYKAATPAPLSLSEWRRTQVSLLVSDTYRLVHRYKGKVFGISPAADINSNYNTLFANVKSWINTNGYVDYIAPQLYFGYKYPINEFKFNNILNTWVSLKRQKNIKLYIGLAPYKINTEDNKSREWITDKEIISRQICDTRTIGVDGIMLYSYSYVFKNEKPFMEELKKIKQVLK